MFDLSSFFLSFSFFSFFGDSSSILVLAVSREATVEVSPVDGQIWLVFMSLTSYLYESCALEIIQWIFELQSFFCLQ